MNGQGSHSGGTATIMGAEEGVPHTDGKNSAVRHNHRRCRLGRVFNHIWEPSSDGWRALRRPQDLQDMPVIPAAFLIVHRGLVGRWQSLKVDESLASGSVPARFGHAGKSCVFPGGRLTTIQLFVLIERDFLRISKRYGAHWYGIIVHQVVGVATAGSVAYAP